MFHGTMRGAIFLLIALPASLAWCQPRSESPSSESPKPGSQSEGDGGESWFNGDDLEGWEVLEKYVFRRHGEVEVRDGAIHLETGAPATGIRWADESVARSNYEISLDAQRIEGRDFLCALTFPVGESHCSLILGGWGGGVTGLSNVDDYSADENETSGYVDFENGTWYHIRLRITDEKIEAWVDDKQIVDLEREGHEFAVWWEQEPARPLGMSTWYSAAAYRNIRYRTWNAPAESP